MADNPSPGPSKVEQRIITGITAVIMVTLVVAVVAAIVFGLVALGRLVF